MRKLLPGRKSSEKGQVVLIVLLVMSVILVVGLSIASRSVTDIKISQQSQEASRALWVAQAGLEEAMKSNRSIASSEEKKLSGVDYSVTKTGIGAGQEYVFPESVAADKAVTFWLINHDANGEISSGGYPGGGKLTFCWGKENTPSGDSTTPALEATLIYAVGGNYRTRRFPFDPNSGRSPATNFTVVNSDCSCDGKNFAFCSNEINLAGGTPYFVRLKLLFNTDTAHPIGVKGNADFPQQGNCYDSLATIPESGVTRKLRQCQLWSTAPSIFDNVLFSGVSIQ